MSMLLIVVGGVGRSAVFRVGIRAIVMGHGMRIRRTEDADLKHVLAIINDAAQAYRGVIPADRWHEPYMPEQELASEIANGITFWVAEEEGQALGVIGLQDKGAVALIRHAYVAPTTQRKGVGTKLLRHVEALTAKPVLIGTWADASWAIDFYRRNGFTLVPPPQKDRLLRTYWSIPDRQIETSVVLADQRWSASQ
jgi:N-acetylglutamate synthase-like GNAT family acetyltransferase